MSENKRKGPPRVRDVHTGEKIDWIERSPLATLKKESVEQKSSTLVVSPPVKDSQQGRESRKRRLPPMPGETVSAVSYAARSVIHSEQKVFLDITLRLDPKDGTTIFVLLDTLKSVLTNDLFKSLHDYFNGLTEKTMHRKQTLEVPLCVSGITQGEVDRISEIIRETEGITVSEE